MTPSLRHHRLASVSASSFSSMPLWPGTQVMWMRESLFPSRNSRACLEKRMESCWDGWVWVREILDIAEELSERKTMDLMRGSSSAKRLATNIPAARVKDTPSYVFHLLPRPHEPHQTTFTPFLMTMPAPVLFFHLTFLRELSVAITSTPSFLSASSILRFVLSSCSVCSSFGGRMVVEKHGWEERFCTSQLL